MVKGQRIYSHLHNSLADKRCEGHKVLVASTDWRPDTSLYFRFTHIRLDLKPRRSVPF